MLNILNGIRRYRKDTTCFDISKSPCDKTLKIMTYNIRCLSRQDHFKKSWYNRAPLVIKAIEENKPDIIGFQEVCAPHEEYLKGHLLGYSLFMNYRADGKKPEGLMIAYRTDRFEEREKGIFWLSETPDVLSKSWDAQAFRIASYVTLTDKIMGKTFTVIDTHLDHLGKDARENGMKVILQEQKKRNFGTLILLGDMNDVRNSPMYIVATEGGLEDGRNLAKAVYDGPGSTWHDYGKFLSGEPIDFFFVSPGLSIDSYTVFDKTYNRTYPSDHFPVVITIPELP